MKKTIFKTSFQNFLQEEVEGLTSEQKIKYMKKWIREYQTIHESRPSTLTNGIDSTMKIGVLVRTTLNDIIKNGLLTSEKIILLQDERYCKETFDINYPMLKKVNWNLSLLNQRKINGYERYWAEPVMIHSEKYLVCNDWYERNKSKFIMWTANLT